MKKTSKKNLGKGLSALLGNNPATAMVNKHSTSDGLAPSLNQISAIDKIYPGSFQPRQDFSSPELR